VFHKIVSCLCKFTCYCATGSAHIPYLKTLLQRGSFSIVAVSMEANLKTFEGSSCQGNSPLYVLLNNDGATQAYLEQVNLHGFRALSTSWLPRHKVVSCLSPCLEATYICIDKKLILIKYYYHLLTFTATYTQNIRHINKISLWMTTKRRLNTLYNTSFHLGEFSKGTRDSVAGWSTKLQAEKSRVRIPMRSLMFVIDLWNEMSTWNLPGVWFDCLVKMWGPRRLTTLWASMACYSWSWS
jgi:hypothetical protein